MDIKDLLEDLNKIEIPSKKRVKASVGNVSSDRMKKINELDKKINSVIKEGYSDEEMVIRTLARIHQLAFLITERVESGEPTQSWQEAKIYVCLDSMESVMSGFPVRSK